jgi:hypothetical protein
MGRERIAQVLSRPSLRPGRATPDLATRTSNGDGALVIEEPNSGRQGRAAPDATSQSWISSGFDAAELISVAIKRLVCNQAVDGSIHVVSTGQRTVYYDLIMWDDEDDADGNYRHIVGTREVAVQEVEDVISAHTGPW